MGGIEKPAIIHTEWKELLEGRIPYSMISGGRTPDPEPESGSRTLGAFNPEEEDDDDEEM